MRVIEYKDIDRVEWRELVQASSTGTWFQTPEAYDFFASQPELFRPFVVAVAQDAGHLELQHRTDVLETPSLALRGVCVGYVTVEKSTVKQFFTRRAIIIGGPTLADDCTNEEVEMLMRAVKDSFFNTPIYIETRNLNDYSQWKEAFIRAGFEYMPHLNFHIDCTNKTIMESRLSDNRRRQIKKAIMSGVEITEAHTEQEIYDWYIILQGLYTSKVKTPLFPLAFFIEAYRQGVAKYLLVKYENKVIGGIMCPLLDGHCVYEWFVCGDDTEYKNQNPSVMATWAAMEYACEHGYARFDFMGAGIPNEAYGVRDFKARFGGVEVEYGRFICITKPFLYMIGKLGIYLLKKLK